MLLCRANWESGSSIEIVAVTDSDPKLWGQKCFDRPIIPPDSALCNRSIPVCIDVSSSSAIASIRDRLIQEYHVPAKNLVEYSTLLMQIWEIGKTADLLRKGYAQIMVRPVSIINDCNMGLGLCGIESWSNMLCSKLRERGWENLRIYVNSELRTETLTGEWVPLSECVDWVGGSPGSGRGPDLDTLRYLAERMPCIIIANSEETLCAACVLKKLYPGGVRIVSVPHAGLETTYRSRAGLKDYVDQFVVVSTDGLRAMAELGCGKEQLRCMQIPFDCEERLERSYSEYDGSPIKIGYAGRLERTAKRMDLLLRLIQSLANKGLNFHMEIAGAGAYEHTVRDFVEKNQMNGKVSMLGRLPREGIPSFWRNQDICVNLSDFEGRSISVTEAMGNGAVPVVTDVSGVRDDITDGVNGYIVPVGGYKAAADRIELLTRNRGRLREMGRAAHDKVYPKSLIEPHIQFWEEILSRMAAQIRF